MKKVSRNMLNPEKIRQVIDSASTTLGVPCTNAETHLLQAIAQEMMHSRVAQKRAKEALESVIGQEGQLTHMAKLIGRVTTAILLSLHLDPRDHHCAQSYLKALGLNLKEKSSGRYVRQRNSGMKTRRHPKPKTRRLSPSCASWLAGSGMWLEAKLTRRPNCLMCRVKRHKSTTN